MDQQNQDDLFSKDASDGNQPDPVSSNPTTDDDDSNPLENLVGEGKKFKSVEDLARGKLESDRFIAQMQQEQRELREELNKRATVEEVLRRIEETRQKRPDPDEDDTPDSDDGNRSVDMSAIEKLVESKFNEAQSEAEKRRNVLSVKETLKQRFGPNYQQVVDEKLKEMDVGRDWANGLAATQPKAFLNLMGNPTPRNEDTGAPPRGHMRPQSSSGPKTYQDFQNLRRENPQRYFSPEIQNLMHRMALENPEEFLK